MQYSLLCQWEYPRHDTLVCRARKKVVDKEKEGKGEEDRTGRRLATSVYSVSFLSFFARVTCDDDLPSQTPGIALGLVMHGFVRIPIVLTAKKSDSRTQRRWVRVVDEVAHECVKTCTQLDDYSNTPGRKKRVAVVNLEEHVPRFRNRHLLFWSSPSFFSLRICNTCAHPSRVQREKKKRRKLRRERKAARQEQIYLDSAQNKMRLTRGEGVRVGLLIR